MKILIKWLFVDGVASLQAAACSPLLTFHKHVCVYVCVCVLHSPWIDRLIKVLVISSTQHIKQEDVAFGSLKTERKDCYIKNKKKSFLSDREMKMFYYYMNINLQSHSAFLGSKKREIIRGEKGRKGLHQLTKT